MGMLCLVALCVYSCGNGGQTETVTEDSREMTELTIMGGEADTIYNVGKILNDPVKLVGKEWLLQNTGKAMLYVDSVTTSCECISLRYPDSMCTARNSYFPVLALLTPEGENRAFSHKIKVYGNFSRSPLTMTIEGELTDEVED